MSERTRKAYDQWASTYDTSPNPQIVLEFPDVLGLLAPTAGETILDAIRSRAWVSRSPK